MKYIIVDSGQGVERAICTVEDVQHCQAVNLAEVKPISAGFFRVKAGLVVVEDRPSTSLNLKPRPQDASIIETTLLLGGVL